jgi:methylisocitrate lyase
MLYTASTPARKRQALRARLGGGRLLRFPGAFNSLSARAIDLSGLEGVYVSGAVVSADLGLPDIGLTTATEMAGRAGQIARMTDLPVIADADTGFGEPANIARTVQTYEDAGLSGLHIEDQVNPKRCGHLDAKQVVDERTAVRRIRAAVDARRDPNMLIIARTDLRGSQNLAATIIRAQALEDAGADMIFPEALADLGEFSAVCEALSVPVMANMTEFGKSELYTTEQLADAGVALVVYPVSLFRLAMQAAEEGLRTLVTEGSMAPAVARMQTRARLYELLDYEGYNRVDADLYNFTVTQR